MASGILGIALSGLNAAQNGLHTTGHNLANVNTEGYSRQQTIQETTGASFSGGGFMGSGVNVVEIKRIYADHLQKEAFSLGSQAAHYSAYSAEISRLNNVVSDEDLNVNAAVDGFFATVQDLSTRPADTAARQAVISSAQNLTARFRTFDAHIDDIREGINARMHNSVAAINSLAKQAAELNVAITRALGTGHAPNDLLDRRDQVITQINREIQVTAVAQKEGSVNLFLANGQSIVIGGNAQQLAVTANDLDAQKKSIGLKTGVGVRSFREDEIVGGTLGGIVAFRDQVLDPAHNAVGRLALAMGAQFNAQHALGQDRNGAAGGDIFTLAPTKVLSAGHNTGSGVLAASVVDYAAITSSDYRVNFDGANYTVTRLSDNTQTTGAALPLTVDGVAIALSSGTPSAGDAFLVQPTRQGAWGLYAEPLTVAQIAAAAPIRSGSASANAGDATIAAGTVLSRGADLTQPVTITFTAPGAYSVTGVGTGNPTGLAYSSGGSIAYNGWSTSISGSPRAGDVFVIGPNNAGTGDNRNAVLLATLAQSAGVDGGTYANAYASILSGVGSKAQEIAAASRSHDAILTQSKEAIAATSGVNLDEEAANLLRYQQAYQAASKVISITEAMFQSILQASH
ncbi:MAG: flagellar hook-associated protein FlgK [Burkholderiales bacterium]